MNKRLGQLGILGTFALGIASGYSTKFSTAEDAPIPAAGISYSLKVSGGKFDLKVQHIFSPTVRFSDIKLALQSESLAAQVSGFVRKVEKATIPPTVLQRLRQAYPGSYPASVTPYYLVSQVVANLPILGPTDLEARAICVDEETTLLWKRSCKMDTSHKNTRRGFHEGSNETVCSQSPGLPASCSINFKGTPRGVNFVVFSKTAEELALSGATQTLRDTSAVFHFLQLGHQAKNDALQPIHADQAVVAFKSTKASANIEQIRFGKDYERAGRGDLEGKTLQLNYSDETGSTIRTLN